MTINERVAALREVMVREKLGVFIFPSTDAHNSEYVADHWKGREWISGFDGSAGVAVVTMHGAALWTDSRYFLAAEKQLGGTEFQLMKLKMPGTPTLAEWIGSQLDGNSEVGVDGTVNSYSFVENLISDLRHEGGITVRLNLDPLKFIWKDRPSIPNNKVVIQPLEYTGEDTRSKITRIKSELHKIHCDGMLVSALDDIAWILNLRGTDVHCNPVFVSYLLIEESNATLFINKEKITGDVMEYLENQKISVQGYDDIAAYLKRKYFAYNIILDPDETNSYMVAQVDKEKTKVVFAKSPVPRMKAVKSAAEDRKSTRLNSSHL